MMVIFDVEESAQGLDDTASEEGLLAFFAERYLGEKGGDGFGDGGAVLVEGAGRDLCIG